MKEGATRLLVLLVPSREAVNGRWMEGTRRIMEAFRLPGAVSWHASTGWDIVSTDTSEASFGKLE